MVDAAASTVADASTCSASTAVTAAVAVPSSEFDCRSCGNVSRLTEMGGAGAEAEVTTVSVVGSVASLVVVVVVVVVVVIAVVVVVSSVGNSSLGNSFSFSLSSIVEFSRRSSDRLSVSATTLVLILSGGSRNVTTSESVGRSAAFVLRHRSTKLISSFGY